MNNSVDSIEVLPIRDVPSRLKEFIYLKKGWLEGYGGPFDAGRIQELGDLFVSHYDSSLPLPYTYPDEGNCIEWEWDVGNHSLSVEVSMDDFKAVAYDICLDDDTADEIEIGDLHELSSWVRLNAFVGENR